MHFKTLEKHLGVVQLVRTQKKSSLRPSPPPVFIFEHAYAQESITPPSPFDAYVLIEWHLIFKKQLDIEINGYLKRKENTLNECCIAQRFFFYLVLVLVLVLWPEFSFVLSQCWSCCQKFSFACLMFSLTLSYFFSVFIA